MAQPEFSEPTKAIIERLLETLGETPGDMLGQDQKPRGLITNAGQAPANAPLFVDFERPLRFDDRNLEVTESVRFMNALGAILINCDVQKLRSYSAVLDTITELTATIDAKISGYLDSVIHHEQFRELEALWRGIAELASAVESEEVTIDFLDVSKEELRSDLADHEQDLFGSELFRKVYTAEYDRYGGKPFAAMIGLYEFESTPEDIDWLRVVGKIANAAHCPFISSVAPSFFYPLRNMEEVAQISDLDAVLAHPWFGKWQELRDTDYAAYIGLTLPRYLLRRPWGHPVRVSHNNSIGYAETVKPGSTSEESNFLWGNSAILFAKNMVRSFEMSGWAQHIRGPRGGGLVEGLAVHTYSKNGYEEIQPPLEIAVPDYRELQFATNGFNALVHKKNEAVATFFSAQSIKKPRTFVQELNTQNAHLVTNLAYTFSIARIAHFVKRMMREYIGGTADGPYVQRVLSNWLGRYVTTITSPDDLTLLYYPFKAVAVTVEPKPGPFGWFKTTLSVLPHQQFEGMDVELRLEAALGGP